MGYERICPVCGKIFYSGVDWGYKRGENYICSYSCLLKYDAKKRQVQHHVATVKKKDRRANRYILYDTVSKKNVTPKEISETTTFSATSIRKKVRRLNPGDLLFKRYILTNCLLEDMYDD